jgi:hypothetical protein
MMMIGGLLAVVACSATPAASSNMTADEKVELLTHTQSYAASQGVQLTTPTDGSASDTLDMNDPNVQAVMNAAKASIAPEAGGCVNLNGCFGCIVGAHGCTCCPFGCGCI